MKLNVGSSNVCGQYKNVDVWVNIDKTNFDCKNFTKGDPLEGLPFEDNYFEEIHCIHVLEHVEFRDHARFLSELYRVTKPNGRIFVEVPDIIGTARQILDLYNQIGKDKFLQEADAAALREAIRCTILSVYGKGRYEGDIHRWGFYPEWLEEIVRRAGFKDVSEQKEMISSHWKQEPVILVRGTKYGQDSDDL